MRYNHSGMLLEGKQLNTAAVEDGTSQGSRRRRGAPDD
jgi:hypothetical protein